MCIRDSNKSIAWQRKCDGDKRKCHARDEMPEDSDPFQDVYKRQSIMRLMDGEILMEVTITGAGTVGQRGTLIR